VNPQGRPYLPLDPRGFRLAMGLRPLELSRWLEIDEHRTDELSQKADLFRERRDAVLAVRDAGEAASQELLGEVVRWFEENAPTIQLPIDDTEHPLLAASRLAQEDFCVLVKSDTWRLEAAAVCFPSRWSLATKIGTTMDEIHGPVPLYDNELAQPTNSFFDRLKPDRSFWRLNWTLLDSPDLHQPTSTRRPPSGELADWFFRVERQTLRQLPRTGAVIFTIRTYVSSAADLVASHEDFGPLLLQSLDTAPVAMQEYKGWVGVADRLRAAITNE
jgi:dimethylamine monooxygenase subunit A